MKLERGQRIDNLETGRPEVRSAVDRAQRFLGLTAPRGDPRRRRGRARHAALRRAPPRRLRGDALHRRDAGAAPSPLHGRISGAGLAACAAGCAIGFVAQEAIAAAVAEVVRAELPPPRLAPAVQGFLVGSCCSSASRCRRSCSSRTCPRCASCAASRARRRAARSPRTPPALLRFPRFSCGRRAT